MAWASTAIVGETVAAWLEVVVGVVPPILAVRQATTLTAHKERQKDWLDGGREVVAALGEWPAAREVRWDA